MSENILSLEDLKFLEKLYGSGLTFLRVDDAGISTNDALVMDGVQNSGSREMLNEISKKMRYRLNSNFQMNFSSGINFDIVKF